MKERIQTVLNDIWYRWQTRIRNLDTNDKIAILIICSFFTISLVVLHISYIDYFPYNEGDKGVIYQLFYNTVVHGNFFYSSINGGMIDFAGHQRYFLLLLLPFFAVYPYPITISFISSALLALGALPVYWLSSEISKSKRIGLLFVFLYVMYPSISWLVLESVKEEIFALPLLLFAFYYMVRGSFSKFIIFLFLAGICKQNIPLVIIMFGVYAYLEKMDRKWILAPVLLGSGFLAIEFFVLQPFFTQLSSNMYGYAGDSSILTFTGSRYSYLGNTPSAMVINALSHPMLIFNKIFSGETLTYITLLLVPVGFISLLKPKILLIGLPIFLQNILSIVTYQTMLSWHYVSILVFVIIVAAIFAFADLYNKLPKTFKPGLIILLILFSGASFFYLSAASDTYSHITSASLKNDDSAQLTRVLENIPEDASVLSSIKFGPYVYRSKEVSYPFWTGKPVSTVYDYYVLDRTGLNYYNSYSAFAQMNQLMDTGKYETKYTSGQTIIIGLANSSTTCKESPNLFYRSQIGNEAINCPSNVSRHVFYSLKSERKAGYLVFGPYIILPNGTFIVTYSIRADNISDFDSKIARLEITSIDSSTLHNSIDTMRDIYPQNLTSGQDTKFNLSIKIHTTNKNRLMEFRVFQYSNADLYVSDINISQIKQ